MNAASIVSCAQCPTCRTYVPIPPALLASLNHAPPPPPRVENPVPIPQPIPSYIQPNSSYIQPNPIPVRPFPPPLPPVGAPAYGYSEYENSWRSKCLATPVLIHGIVEIVLTVLILLLEIVSLGLSTYGATGAGIWCAIPFMTAGILTVRLVRKYDRSRFWATRVFIAQIVLIVFSFILIGIVGSFVSSYGSVSSLNNYAYTYGNNFSIKYQIMQAQLAFGILLLFSGIAYLIFYGVVTYLALWKPHHTLDTSHLFRE